MGAPAVGLLPRQFARDLTSTDGVTVKSCRSNRGGTRLRCVDAGHCLTPLALRRLLDGFDDEGRRLPLLQSATLTTPDALPSLSSRFFTTRYRDEFLQWLEQQGL